MKFYEKGFRTFKLDSGEKVRFLEMALFKGLEDLTDIPNLENIVNNPKYKKKKDFIQAAVLTFSRYDNFDINKPITFGVYEEIEKMRKDWEKLSEIKREKILQIAAILDREKWSK